MLYGFSGYGGFGQTPTMSMQVGTRVSQLPSRGTVAMTTSPAWRQACSRLQSKLAAYDQSDPQKICEDALFAGGCAGAYVRSRLSYFHQAFIAELNALKPDAASASMLLYCAADAASKQTGLTGEESLNYLLPTYQKVMGQAPLDADAAAVQAGAPPPGPLTSKPGLYGGVKTADAPTALLPAGTPQTTYRPGSSSYTPTQTADEETAITPGYDNGYQPTPDPGPSGQQDVIIDEVPCPQGYVRPQPGAACVPVNGQPPVVQPKKAVWPWVLGGALVLGVGGWAIFAAGKKKKRRR